MTKHKRFGPDQEALVCIYKHCKDPNILDAIMACCQGLCAFAYSTIRPGVPFPEYWQEAFGDIEKAIEDFDPAKGKFGTWITCRFLRAAQTVRGRENRYKNRHVAVGLVPEQLDSTPANDALDAILEEANFQKMVEVLRQNQLRFSTEPEAGICKYILKYLLDNQRWPASKELDGLCQDKGVGRTLVNRLMVYLRSACIKTLEDHGWVEP